MGQIEELIRKLLGNLGGVVGDPVSSVTRDLSEGSYLGDPRSRTGVQTRPAQKSSKMSQEAMDAYKEFYCVELETVCGYSSRQVKEVSLVI